MQARCACVGRAAISRREANGKNRTTAQINALCFYHFKPWQERRAEKVATGVKAAKEAVEGVVGEPEQAGRERSWHHCPPSSHRQNPLSLLLCRRLDKPQLSDRRRLFRRHY